MPNPDSDARDVASHEPSPAQTSPHQDLVHDSLAPQDQVANGPDPLPSRPKPARRKKSDGGDAADTAGLFDTSAPSAPSDIQQVPPARPRSPPRRKPAKAASAPSVSQGGPEMQPDPVEMANPSASQTPAPSPQTPTPSIVAAADPAEGAIVDADAASAGQAVAAPAALPEADQPREVRDTPPTPVASAPVVPAPRAGAEPGKPLTISASDAALAIVNPHPIRANDRPDGYLYHLTSPNEAKLLLQSGLPCSFDDPIILTERGGIPYWMSVLAEDVDDILDGPAAVTVLRVRRRAVQNAIESDADSSRAAQAPCYLLTGVSNLPPAPPAAPPPLLRARLPAPTGDAAESGPGVETAGTVKWYNPRKGFGFITPGGGGKDVFVHASTLERAGLAQLTDGQSVRMQVIQGAKGSEAASLSLG
jgi:cold shock CspA family protein